MKKLIIFIALVCFGFTQSYTCDENTPQYQYGLFIPYGTFVKFNGDCCYTPRFSDLINLEPGTTADYLTYPNCPGYELLGGCPEETQEQGNTDNFSDFCDESTPQYIEGQLVPFGKYVKVGDCCYTPLFGDVIAIIPGTTNDYSTFPGCPGYMGGSAEENGSMMPNFGDSCNENTPQYIDGQTVIYGSYVKVGDCCYTPRFGDVVAVTPGTTADYNTFPGCAGYELLGGCPEEEEQQVVDDEASQICIGGVIYNEAKSYDFAALVEKDGCCYWATANASGAPLGEVPGESCCWVTVYPTCPGYDRSGCANDRLRRRI